MELVLSYHLYLGPGDLTQAARVTEHAPLPAETSWRPTFDLKGCLL